MDQHFFLVRNIAELKIVLCSIFNDMEQVNRLGYDHFEEDFEIQINRTVAIDHPDYPDSDYVIKNPESNMLSPDDFAVNESWDSVIPGILYVYYDCGFDRIGDYSVKLKDVISLKDLGL